VITIDAASDPVLRAMLPPQDVRRRVLKVLSKLPNDVVATDVTLEQFSDSKRGHKYLSQYGQATHFMANKGQSQRTAYAAGVEKVFGPAERAVKLFKKIADDSDLATRTASPLDDVSVALADGVHALQDSFSPTHVQRDKLGDKFVIMRLQVWSEQDKKDHKAGDESWKGKDGKLTPLGQACREATLTLLSYFIFRVINKDADAERQRRLLMDKYFCPAGPGRSGW